MRRQPSADALRRQLDALYGDVDRGLADPHEVREDARGNPTLCGPCLTLAEGLAELDAELRRAEERAT